MVMTFDESILEYISDPVTVIDAEYHLVYANSVKTGLLRRKLKDIRGKLCYEVTFGQKEPCSRCPVGAVLITGRSCIIERRFEKGDGTKVWSEIRAYPVLSNLGSISSIIVIGIDITCKKKENENRLRYIEELERSLAEISTSQISISQEEETLSDQRNLPVNLSSRETMILRLMARGFTNPEIADIISVSTHTVKTHTINIFNKIGVNDRTQAAVWAVRHGIL